MALITFTNPAQKYPWVNRLWIVALIALPVILWIFPATYFDSGQSICPSKLFLNIECMGCGITRAVQHMHHLDWREALYHNYAVIFVYPLLIYFWYNYLRTAILREIHWRRNTPSKNFSAS